MKRASPGGGDNVPRAHRAPHVTHRTLLASTPTTPLAGPRRASPAGCRSPAPTLRRATHHARRERPTCATSIDRSADGSLSGQTILACCSTHPTLDKDECRRRHANRAGSCASHRRRAAPAPRSPSTTPSPQRMRMPVAPHRSVRDLKMNPHLHAAIRRRRYATHARRRSSYGGRARPVERQRPVPRSRGGLSPVMAGTPRRT